MSYPMGLSPEEENCLQESKIHVFLLSLLFSFISALFVAIVFELTFKYLKSKNNSSDYKKLSKWKASAHHIFSDHSKPAKLFELIVLFATTLSFIIFLIGSRQTGPAGQGDGAEKCEPFSESLNSILDLVLNLFFVFYFFIRLYLATNKVWFMFEIYSLVDFMTIPPAFLVIYMDRTWIGFKFLRAVMFWHLPDLLIRFNKIKTTLALTFVKLMTGFAILVLISSGFIFLFENSGDPLEFTNGHTIPYRKCVSYIIFLITTIGPNYNTFPTTEYGNGFSIALIIVLLTSLLWFLVRIFHKNLLINTIYPKSLSLKTQKFIIISGYLSKDSLQPIFDAIYNKKQKKYNNIEIVLMDTKPPELEENWSFKLKRVQYFCGSVLNHKDLKRLQAHKADRCILLAKKHSKDADSEDATNIMNVMSVKTYCKQIPITVQLIRSQNKYYLNAIPVWFTNKGDKVLCISELRLRIIGQSCLAPGLNTLLYNLVSPESHKPSKTNGEVEKDYINGTKMQIFVKNLSPAFDEMTFSQICELCFTKFGIILFAIKIDDNQKIVINPKPDFKLAKLTRAFFIAENKDFVKCAVYYCLNCHSDVTDVKLIDKCKCLRVEDIVKQRYVNEMGFDTEEEKSEEINLLQLTSHPIEKSQDIKESDSKPKKKKSKDKNKAKKDKKPKKRKDSTSSTTSSDSTLESDKQINEFNTSSNYDSSASFHYCPHRTIDECLLKRDDTLLNALSDHVIIGLLTEKDSPLIGLKDLVLTLRTSNIELKDLKPVLIVGELDFIRREWPQLENIPEVYVFEGSVLCRDHLNYINLIVCNICVILSANLSNEDSGQLGDRLSILANINVKTFSFDDSKLQLLALRVKDTDSYESKPPLKLQRKGSVYYVNIPVITEVQTKDNIGKVFVESRDQNMDIIGGQSFWSGSVFITSFIDSLTSLSYLKSEVVSLIETLVSGGLTTKLENILCKTECLQRKALSYETMKNRDRCRVTQIALKGTLNKYKHAKFGQLFTESLNTYGMLCFGVYRLLSESDSNNGSDVRYVITNPSSNFQLNENDLIFAFIQFKENEPR